MKDECYICEGPIHKFISTPILALPNGSFVQICEDCADKEFPGWREDDE